ncbi:hypothetical protein V8E53_004653 [Lactarius tabidus]
MDAIQTRRRFADLQFRVLVIGRANAGKTSILRRVCETTESPTIYRGDDWEEVCGPRFCQRRGEHCIDDALVFSNHTGYVFHDSQGIEAGDEEKLEILKEFIRRKCGEKKLRDKLHAIWYCIPMDDHRPGLNLRFFKDICPDQNVPVIAVFTKYDQFLFNVEMDVLDDPDKYPDGNVAQIAEKRFQDHYLGPLGDSVRYVRLEKMNEKDSRCDSLVEKTAGALNEDAITLMLLAVQKSNLELSVKMALRRSCSVQRLAEINVKNVIRECLFPFPYIWASVIKLQLIDTLTGTGCLSFYALYLLMVLSLLIKHITSTSILYLTFVEAAILILRHATLLLPSNESEAALTQAELDYQESSIDLKIQEYLVAFASEDVSQFAGFIKATEIGVFVLLSFTTTSYETISFISVLSENRGINS